MATIGDTFNLAEFQRDYDSIKAIVVRQADPRGSALVLMAVLAEVVGGHFTGNDEEIYEQLRKFVEAYRKRAALVG